MKIFKLIPSVLIAFVILFAGAGLQAQTLAKGTRIQDSAQCDNITATKNAGSCKACVRDKGTWVTGGGCQGAPADKDYFLAKGTGITDRAQCSDVPSKTAVEPCQRCVAGKGTYIVGKGCKQ